MERLGVGAPLTMLAYALRRAARALLTAAGLILVVGLLAGSGAACSSLACVDTGAPAAWLGRLARLDLGRGADNVAVGTAIGSAALPSLLLLAAAALIVLLAGWGGGLLLAAAESRGGSGMPVAAPAQAAGRALAALAGICQGVPSFWLGGVLVALASVGLGWLPPGGIAAPTLPAFGSAEYVALLHAHPGVVLGDLLAHLTLPALTLALAALATPLRLIRSILPAEARTPHARVARAKGLAPRRLLWRAARPTLPAVIGAAAGDLPLLLSALVLVEYLFGWPGLGLLAYHAARSGDAATLWALALLVGLFSIAVGLLADLVAARADPRLRGAARA